MDTLGLRAASLATYVTKIMTRVASPSSFDTGGAPRVQAAELCGDTVRLLGRNRAMRPHSISSVIVTRSTAPPFASGRKGEIRSSLEPVPDGGTRETIVCIY